ncbi:hypothetical protein [Hyphomicrobium sp. DY-1]|uniref:hypothetical protein n=1 Tax=Hyphomicrobium sp. DY-1 TaxID=3075650 RepID=UPI0039C11FF3
MSLPTTFAGARPSLTDKWSAMVVTGLQDETDRLARKIVANKARYLAVQKATGVPWFFIGALHARESSCNFKTHLHNGDPLTGKTFHVPAGRPLGRVPKGGFTWEASAIDALKMKKLQNVVVWSVERMAWQGENYNGPGYRNKGLPSPYVWAGTNAYVSGKFVADHVYDADHVDTQPGIMVVIKRVSELDASFVLASEGEKKTVVQTFTSTPEVRAQTHGVIASLLAIFYAIWNAILYAFGWLGHAAGVLPDATNSAQQAVSQAETVGSLLRVPVPVFVLMLLGTGALIFGLIRLTRKAQVHG